VGESRTGVDAMVVGVGGREMKAGCRRRGMLMPWRRDQCDQLERVARGVLFGGGGAMVGDAGS